MESIKIKTEKNEFGKKKYGRKKIDFIGPYVGLDTDQKNTTDILQDLHNNKWEM